MSKAILVVDDEDGLRKAICSFLIMNKFNVFEASTAENAMKIFTSNNIDLLITDFLMPITNGLELSKEVLRIKPETKVIMYTAAGLKEQQEELKNLNINVLYKPLRLNAIQEVINEVLELEDKASN